MPDDRRHLERTLAELESELAKSAAIDPAAAARSQALLADLRRAVAPGASGSVDPHDEGSLRDRVSAAALEFEATHPTLSGTLGSIIDALGRMGI